MKKLLVFALLFLSSVAVALPNPASVYCEQHGGKSTLEKKMDPHGWRGLCLFPDHSVCEEWSYFRKTCRPGEHFHKDKVL